MKIIVINICFIFVLFNSSMNGMFRPQGPRPTGTPYKPQEPAKIEPTVVEPEIEPIQPTDLAEDVKKLIQKCLESFGPYLSPTNRQQLANVLNK
jgi:hypothetical protein